MLLFQDLLHDVSANGRCALQKPWWLFGSVKRIRYWKYLIGCVAMGFGYKLNSVNTGLFSITKES